MAYRSFHYKLSDFVSAHVRFLVQSLHSLYLHSSLSLLLFYDLRSMFKFCQLTKLNSTMRRFSLKNSHTFFCLTSNSYRNSMNIWFYMYKWMHAWMDLAFLGFTPFILKYLHSILYETFFSSERMWNIWKRVIYKSWQNRWNPFSHKSVQLFS